MRSPKPSGHPDGGIFLSLFRGKQTTLTAACLVAEMGDERGRYPTVEVLAASAGMSPVAVESGKRKVAGSAERATSA